MKTCKFFEKIFFKHLFVFPFFYADKKYFSSRAFPLLLENVEIFRKNNILCQKFHRNFKCQKIDIRMVFSRKCLSFHFSLCFGEIQKFLSGVIEKFP